MIWLFWIVWGIAMVWWILSMGDTSQDAAERDLRRPLIPRKPPLVVNDKLGMAIVAIIVVLLCIGGTLYQYL